MSTVRKWGNSLAVRIPAVLAGQMDVKDGAQVELTVRNGELIVRPVKRAGVILSSSQQRHR